jgi:hypothetical protein
LTFDKPLDCDPDHRSDEQDQPQQKRLVDQGEEFGWHLLR